MDLLTLCRYADEYLDKDAISDGCPNGLQVAGRAEVHKLVSGVTASQWFLEAARDVGADALLVHHGWFWKDEPAPLVGPKRQRIKTLMDADLSLIAYHLPLDVHPEVGNNVELIRRLGLEPDPVTAPGPLPGLIRLATMDRTEGPEDLALRIERTLERTPLWIDGGPPEITRIAVCTGGGQKFIEQAAAAGADAFISGEISEQTTHAARELGIHYYAAGHHATERYGVQVLGEHLAERFGITHQFIDINNPA